jgi:hypothetical protein
MDPTRYAWNMRAWIMIIPMLATACRSRDESPPPSPPARAAPKPVAEEVTPRVQPQPSSPGVAREPARPPVDRPAAAPEPEPEPEPASTPSLRIVFDVCTVQPRRDHPAPAAEASRSDAPRTLDPANPMRAYESDILGCFDETVRVNIPYTVILTYAADGTVTDASVISSARTEVDACIARLARQATRAPGQPGMLRCPVHVRR